MKNPVLSGDAWAGCCGREQDGGQDQQQELPEPGQEKPQVVADGAEHNVDDVFFDALDGISWQTDRLSLTPRNSDKAHRNCEIAEVDF